MKRTESCALWMLKKGFQMWFISPSHFLYVAQHTCPALLLAFADSTRSSALSIFAHWKINTSRWNKIDQSWECIMGPQETSCFRKCNKPSLQFWFFRFYVVWSIGHPILSLVTLAYRCCAVGGFGFAYTQNDISLCSFLGKYESEFSEPSTFLCLEKI